MKRRVQLTELVHTGLAVCTLMGSESVHVMICG